MLHYKCFIFGLCYISVCCCCFYAVYCDFIFIPCSVHLLWKCSNSKKNTNLVSYYPRIQPLWDFNLFTLLFTVRVSKYSFCIPLPLTETLKRKLRNNFSEEFQVVRLSSCNFHFILLVFFTICIYFFSFN